MARTTMELMESFGFQNKFVKETCEHKSTIPKWSSLVWHDNELKEDIIYEIHTGKPNRLQTKWVVRLNVLREPAKVHYMSSWKMVEMKNFKGELEAKASITIHGPGTTKQWVKGDSEFSKAPLNEHLEAVRYYVSDQPDAYTYGDEVLITLKPDIRIPSTIWSSHLNKMCFKKVDRDFLGILRDKSTADLKIVTSDEKELFAHKCILKARCPVFESMFRSNYLENNTGIVNVEDISGKTMGILLHYFYSGQLLETLYDEDTIVEFLYAAGKYQITEVLEILDLRLGTNSYNAELYEQLLDITNKLGLLNAEARLQRSVKKRKIEQEAEQQNSNFLSVCLNNIL